MDAESRMRFATANEQMAARALRVLALAVKHFDEGVDSLSDEELESGYTFIGLVGMIDPPRSEVADAIRRARLAGIRTVMLTGDQLNTGQAIARELGLGAARTSCSSRSRFDWCRSESSRRTRSHY